MTEFPIVTLCEAYARLRCAARAMARADQPIYADLLRDVAEMVVEEAPDEAFHDLDTIKRILEIDTTITDPVVVLLRASIHLPPETKPEELPD